MKKYFNLGFLFFCGKFFSMDDSKSVDIMNQLNNSSWHIKTKVGNCNVLGIIHNKICNVISVKNLSPNNKDISTLLNHIDYMPYDEFRLQYPKITKTAYWEGSDYDSIDTLEKEDFGLLLLDNEKNIIISSIQGTLNNDFCKDTHTGNMFSINFLGTHNSYQKKGYAQLLLNTLQEILFNQNKNIQIQLINKSTVKNFYIKNGFKECPILLMKEYMNQSDYPDKADDIQLNIFNSFYLSK
jgi:ribosomal protein S18 acetylase RimI-like enzyme